MMQDRYSTNNSIPNPTFGGSMSSSSSSSNSSNLRPYYSPGTFQAPLKVQEPSFSNYSNSAIISGSNAASSAGNGHSSSFGGSGSILDRSNNSYTSASNLRNLSSTSSTTTGRIVKTNDYDYLDIGSTGDTVVELLRSMLRLYGKIFISQPWRVGRLVSQIGDWSDVVPPKNLTNEDSAHLAALGVDTNVLANYNDENDYGEHGLSEEHEDNDDEEDDDDLYKVPRPQLNQYAYRSSSSLSFRSDSQSRRSLVPEDEALDPTEEELDDEMSYFTSAGNGPSSRRPHKSTRAPRNNQNRLRDASSRRNSGSVGSSSNPPRKTNKNQVSRKSADNSNKNALVVHDIYTKFEKYTNRIHPNTLDTMDIVYAVYEESGLRGMWRALNTTFILEAFHLTIEAWLSGFYSSLFGVPDPHFLDMAYSPMPGTSLLTAVAAGVTTAVILAPISIIRTRLMTTTLQTGPRSLRTLLTQLDTWVCPSKLLFPTIVFAGVTSLVRKSSGFVIQVVLGIDRVAMPTLYSMFTFCSSLIEVGVKLPLETIVRRGHMAYLTEPEEEQERHNQDKESFSKTAASSSYTSRNNSVSNLVLVTPKLQPSDLIIRPEPYEGVFGTLWSVVSGKVGVETLYRGWWWCIIGAISDLSLETVAETEYGGSGKERF